MTDLVKNSVVVPIDFSHFSDKSLRAALPYVTQAQNVHAIHVVSAVMTGEIWHDPDASARLKSAEQSLRKFLDEHGFNDVTVVVRSGDPGAEIAKYATEINAELIVISSHGYNQAFQFFLGSVTERVVRMAHCQVLVLRNGRPEAK